MDTILFFRISFALVNFIFVIPLANDDFVHAMAIHESLHMHKPQVVLFGSTRASVPTGARASEDTAILRTVFSITPCGPIASIDNIMDPEEVR